MRSLIFITTFFLFISTSALAAESLSYSGRLVNANGSPVTGTVNLQFDLGYTTATPPIVNICAQTINNVPLTNGVFHVKLDPNCGGSVTLSQVIFATPAGESLAIRVTDQTHSKTYSYQALHSMPSALVANKAKSLDQKGASPGQFLTWDGNDWAPSSTLPGSGTVTSITAGTGLNATVANPITTTGTISIANGGVNTAQLADDAITNAKVSSIAGIARTKLATGTANAVVVNNASGVMSEVAVLPITQGGTGANSDSGARTNLGLGTAATANTGYAAGNVLPADNLPVCLPSQKLIFTGVGPAYWSCATDNDTTADATKLPLAGGTMTGNIVMGTHEVLLTNPPSTNTSAANKLYVDSEIADAISGIGGSQWLDNAPNIYFNTGNVGIGTNLPQAKFHIRGDAFGTPNTPSADSVAVFEKEGTDAGITLFTGGANKASVYFGVTNAAQRGAVSYQFNGVSTVDQMAFTTNSAVRMTIDGTGNVNVTGNVSSNGRVRLKSDNTNYVELRAPGSLASTLTFTMPPGHGSSGNALTTDGAGNLSWSAVTTSSSALSGDVTGTLTTTTIANDTITSAKIVDGTITSADIADGTIPYVKLNIADADIPLAKMNGLVTALAGKESSITAGTSLQYWRGDKTWQTLNTTSVPEGTNLYFLESRVRTTLLNGYAIGTAQPIAQTDTLIEALQKIEGSIASLQSSGQWTSGSGNVYRTTGNVGIGITNPYFKLDVHENNTDTHINIQNNSSTTARYPGVLVQNYNGGVGGGPSFTGIALRGSYGSPAPVQANDALFILSGNGASNTSYGSITGAQIKMEAAQTFSPTASGTNISFATAQSGTTSLQTRMTVMNDGRIGVGTGAPDTLLHVGSGSGSTLSRFFTLRGGWVGSDVRHQNLMTFAGTASSDADPFTETTGEPAKNWHIGMVGDNGYWNHSRFSFVKAGVEAMTIRSSGNVGIGLSAPSRKLHIFSTSGDGISVEDATNPFLHLRRDASNEWYTVASATGANNLEFRHTNLSTAPVLSISTANRLGINTSSPLAPLHVSGYAIIGAGNTTFTSSSNFILGDSNSITNSGGGNANLMNIFGNSNAISTSLFNFGYSLTLVGTSNTVNNAGNAVIVGRSNNVTAGNTVTIGNGISNPTASSMMIGPSNTAKITILSTGNTGIGVSPSYKLDVGGDINSSGSVRASGVALTSDRRFKKDIHTLNRALDKILKLRGVSYSWRSNDFPERNFVERAQIGVIAQEVEQVFPQLVDTDRKGYKSVNYMALVAPLIESTKELHAETVHLKAQLNQKDKEVASLKKENEDIKSRLDMIEKALLKMK